MTRTARPVIVFAPQHEDRFQYTWSDELRPAVLDVLGNTVEIRCGAPWIVHTQYTHHDYCVVPVYRKRGHELLGVFCILFF